MSRVFPITDHQRRIIDLISEGLSRDQIADELDINEGSVRQIVDRLCRRLDCPMRELPAEVERRGL